MRPEERTPAAIGASTPIGAVVVALALLLVGNVPTAAAGQFSPPTIVSSTASVSAEGAGASTAASCPRGTSLVSGGFATTLVDAHGPVAIESSAASRDVWQTSVEEYAGGADSFTSFANCARGAPSAHASTGAATLSSEAPVGSATAQCPNTSEVIAGGFATSYDGAARQGNLVFESRRVADDAWRVSAVHTLGGAPTDLTAIAYCGHAPPLQEQSSSVTIASGFGPIGVNATCPAGTIAASGGFASSVEPGQPSVAAFPAASHLLDAQTWSAQAIFPGMGGPFEFTAYAYCGATR